MILYHGTTATLTDADLRDGLCLAREAEVADGYLEGEAGRIYQIELDQRAEIADEDDLAEVAQKLGISWEEFGDIYHAADQPQVRAALAADDWHAASYRGLSAGNEYDHDTVVLLTVGVARIVGCTEINAIQ